MAERLKNYIGGKLVAAKTNEYLPVTNPATGEIIVEVPLGGGFELDMAVAAAAAAQKTWGKTPVKDRVQVLFRRVPRFHQVMVETNAVDADDGRFRIGVGGQQHFTGFGI